MSKVRVYEVAKQLNLEPKAVVALFQAVGVPDVKNHMSSVDVDAVERVKKHLEKQRTHDVVEERIRPTVVKRRAVAKPEGSIPAPPPSRTDVMVKPDNGSSNDLSREAFAREERASVRDVAPPAPASSARIPTPPPSAVPEAPRSRGSVANLDAGPASIPEPSAPSVQAAAVQAAPSAPSLPEVEAPQEAAPPVEAAPVVESAPPQVAAAAVASPSLPPDASPDAPRQVRTGVEYWQGRPGVPMPPPVATRPLSGGAIPRRVQYDPRTGTTGAGGPPRGNIRPGGPGGMRGPMGRGFGMSGGPRRFGAPQGPRPKSAVSTLEMGAHKKVIRIEENVTLSVMAQKMSMKATELLMKLISMGMTGIHINSSLDADTAKILASEFGWDVEDVAQSEEQSIALARGEDAALAEDTSTAEGLERRAPVVTVMGHVDHGKTSLLDKIRKANVAAGEAGGITQHIGAYKVQTQRGTVVFLDTPGHEAFTQMRARGASVTDIIILVVAADDGVMPQTKEAIAHAKAAAVPVIVAVNKIDKPGAEPDRVKRELVELGLQPEEWGGDTIYVNVSALTGENLDTLVEMVSLQAEVLDLKANPAKPASGTVIEALLDRGRGPVARVLVQDGTLRVGDYVLAGAGFGKVRAMTNEHGKQIQEAGPATPVEILGLAEVPGAGDPMHAVKDSKKAQEIAESRRGKLARSLIPATAKVSLEEISKRIAESGQQELRVVIKGDVQGSVEAVADALAKLSTEKVRLSILHAAVGGITEGDVSLAIASKAVVLGFNVRPAGKARQLADENKVEIRLYSIIYQAIDDIKSAMEGLLPPTLVEKTLGKIEIRQVFKIRGITVAGSYVLSGQVKRNGKVRLFREDVVTWEGKVAGLRRFKDDVKDVQEGFECGISFEGYTDIKEGDVIESFEIEEIRQKL